MWCCVAETGSRSFHASIVIDCCQCQCSVFHSGLSFSIIIGGRAEPLSLLITVTVELVKSLSVLYDGSVRQSA